MRLTGLMRGERFIKSVRALMLAALMLACLCGSALAQPGARGSITGVVKDQAGAVVGGAKVLLVHTQQAMLNSAESDADGLFIFKDVPTGNYEIRIARSDFGTRRLGVQVTPGETANLEVTLEVAPVSDQVTVTAEAGMAQDKDRIVQSVNVIPENAIQLRTTAVLSQVANEEVGLYQQRTSPTIGAIFVRGLTGKNVATYIDGVRYTTSAGRGGINTFFNLNEPSSLRAVEVLRGPNSAQYGSDSLGGTVSLISRSPEFGGANPETHGEFNTFFNSADLSYGGNSLLTYGTRRFGLLFNGSARRVNTLRPANGIDTHSSVTRFLGLPSNVLGNRLTDTAFTQYAGLLRLNYTPDPDQQFILHYQRGQQDGGKRYDQTVGGDGNLIADLRNLMNDFFYARYLKQGVGPLFDNASLTFSYNAQREERVNQGGRGNPFGGITHQYERTQALGFNFFLDKQLGQGNTFLVGGDFYRETVKAPAYTLNPATGISTSSRPRVPNGARYLLYGFYVQDVYEAIPDRLRLTGALRFNVASYLSRAAQSPLVGGLPLWPDDSLRVSDFSGRFGLVLTPFDKFHVAFNYSRGFRAPNITDLGTLGLTGDGFEVDTSAAARLGGTIGTTAGRDAVSSGRNVEQQRSEVSNNFDLSLRYRRGRFDTDLTGFLIDINQAIVKQALILSPGAVGQFLGDQPITSQLPNGVVFVPLSTAPVLVRANFSDARLYGLEYSLESRLTDDFTFGGNFTYIRAYDKATGLPPNIEGGTPPATSFLRLRYQPLKARYWLEAYTMLAGRQNRLSSLDLSDRRTGATRSRNDIRDFFQRGACVRGLVAPGPDGRCATGDETVLILTGETLAQVQNRVLGTATSAPLFSYLPGYGLINLRGGYRFQENSEFIFDFENIGDKNYRGPSWGVEGPGRSLTLRYRYRF
ncbi:MAG TPA: TonB-dependent receptor [Pyrinomonadaceae bacterium]|jgi:outer membrane receptor protein involved in Fe transport